MAAASDTETTPQPPATESDTEGAAGFSGLNVPRFVSLRSDEVYVRSGPGMRYPIHWVFKRRNLPVEVVREYESWRKIRDHEGDEGWVHSSLLSGRRTALAGGASVIDVMAKPSDGASVIARVEERVIVTLGECHPDWCEAEVSGYKGWIQRKFLWGIYEGENFN